MAARKVVKTIDERQFRSSSHREKVVEHVFLGELLRHLWVARDCRSAGAEAGSGDASGTTWCCRSAGVDPARAAQDVDARWQGTQRRHDPWHESLVSIKAGAWCGSC